jgi:hypothetical protein
MTVLYPSSATVFIFTFDKEPIAELSTYPAKSVVELTFALATPAVKAASKLAHIIFFHSYPYSLLKNNLSLVLY